MIQGKQKDNSFLLWETLLYTVPWKETRVAQPVFRNAIEWLFKIVTHILKPEGNISDSF